jgi:UPF0755 protein
LNIKKIIATLSIVVVSGLIIYGFILVQQIFADNTKFTESQVYVYVPTDANYSEVKKLLALISIISGAFDMVANKMSYPQNVKSGRFY